MPPLPLVVDIDTVSDDAVALLLAAGELSAVTTVAGTVTRQPTQVEKGTGHQCARRRRVTAAGIPPSAPGSTWPRASRR
ncbi:hypothetical protein [Nonomuraea bangladeshensis]|uniref:hypothetical protein n=1 Tax=Nonomuraea bangladeshensis TaxID=404385 RepID=UPI0031DA2849